MTSRRCGQGKQRSRFIQKPQGKSGPVRIYRNGVDVTDQVSTAAIKVSMSVPIPLSVLDDADGWREGMSDAIRAQRARNVTPVEGDVLCGDNKASCYCYLPVEPWHAAHRCNCGGSWDREGYVLTLPDFRYVGPSPLAPKDQR